MPAGLIPGALADERKGFVIEGNLIAFEMNGASLHPMNGAPLRLVIPGWPGPCSQKLLTRIWVRDRTRRGLDQRPLQIGLRFSAKARAPSLASSLS
jgi:DMSO/TMAO reductase YedYZ molybdopterin-dependent catalytic subunit